MVVGQDFFSPGDDGVDDVVVFGDLAGVVEVSEPGERLVGPVEVVGFVESVELLESIPSRAQPGVSLEQPLQMRFVTVGEVVFSALGG